LPWDNAGRRNLPGTPTLGRGIFPSIGFQLDKPLNLSASFQRVDEDRVVACSIWSPVWGIIVIQRYKDYSGTVQGQGSGVVQWLRHGSGWSSKTQVYLGSNPIFVYLGLFQNSGTFVVCIFLSCAYISLHLKLTVDVAFQRLMI
jgi:hypothetical protein